MRVATSLPSQWAVEVAAARKREKEKERVTCALGVKFPVG
jgi:hypothetical protein